MSFDSAASFRSPSRPPSFLEQLEAPGPLVSVELRPPRSGLSYERGMDVWIDMYHSITRLARKGVPVFLTDDAVGDREEESLNHLSGNLGRDVDFRQLIPFLTTKHTLEYCLLFAKRAASMGLDALTVLGGDTSVGPPRCVPHSNQLRELIQAKVPGLALGGWANPHGDVARQVGFLAQGDFHASYFLTQVMSHHSLDRVDAFMEELVHQGVTIPGVFGVFYYRSPNPRTLSLLGDFFPVPAEELIREFQEGASPEEICARTLRGLRSAGVEKVYLSNLGTRGVERTLQKILDAV